MVSASLQSTKEPMEEVSEEPIKDPSSKENRSFESKSEHVCPHDPERTAEPHRPFDPAPVIRKCFVIFCKEVDEITFDSPRIRKDVRRAERKFREIVNHVHNQKFFFTNERLCRATSLFSFTRDLFEFAPKARTSVLMKKIGLSGSDYYKFRRLLPSPPPNKKIHQALTWLRKKFCVSAKKLRSVKDLSHKLKRFNFSLRATLSLAIYFSLKDDRFQSLNEFCKSEYCLVAFSTMYTNVKRLRKAQKKRNRQRPAVSEGV